VWYRDILKQCLISEGNRNQYSTALRKTTSMVFLKHGKNDVITVYIPKETILKELAAKIEYVRPHFFFDLVRELSVRRGFLYGPCGGNITRAVNCRIRENWNRKSNRENWNRKSNSIQHN
jgi:hypothetical protein